MISQTGPTYHSLARYITALPKGSPIKLLLNEAGLPPLCLLLDSSSRAYGIRILLAPDSHPCKNRLLKYLAAHSAERNIRGHRWIAPLQQDIFTNENVEDTWGPVRTTPLRPRTISLLTKEEEGKEHKKWTRRLPPGKTLLSLTAQCTQTVLSGVPGKAYK